MASWVEFAKGEPEMVKPGLWLQRKLPGEELGPETAYLATVSEDGSRQVPDLQLPADWLPRRTRDVRRFSSKRAAYGLGVLITPVSEGWVPAG